MYRAWKTGDVIYVGMTTSFEDRAAATSQKMKLIPLRADGSVESRSRAAEQVLIETHGLERFGGTLINKINSIAKSNPIYRQPIARGAELLRIAGYPGF